MYPDVRFSNGCYRVAGADVGDATAIEKTLQAQTAEWNGILRMVSESDARQVQPAYMAIKTAFTPMTKFGYHFQCQPIELTNDLATTTREALLTAFANLAACGCCAAAMARRRGSCIVARRRR